MFLLGTLSFYNLQEEKLAMPSFDSVNSNLGRKRLGSQDRGNLAENVPEKRVKKELDGSTTASQDKSPSSEPPPSKREVDNGPVQQLVAMFGALVAQGEKAVASLEILISSISSDLLADVVIVNMCNLPPNNPSAEGDDEPLQDIGIIGSDGKAKYPPSFVDSVMSLSSTFPSIASLLDVNQSISNEVVL